LIINPAFGAYHRKLSNDGLEPRFIVSGLWFSNVC